MGKGPSLSSGYSTILKSLRPDVKRGEILPDEEDLILRLHRLLGNRWSLIAGRIPGRTDNEIKNFWNTHLSKKLRSQGIDPRTHRPLSESELENHHNSDQNNLSPADHFQDKYPQTAIVADNVQAFNDTTNGASNSMPLEPVLKEYSSDCNQHSCNTVHMNPTLIPYCKSISEVGLSDHDSSLYLRRNSTTTAYFVAPSMTDSILQSIPSFPGTVNEKSSYEGFPLNFELSEMQQRHVPEEIGMDMNAVTPGAISEDNNSDIFVYFLESFMDQDQLHDEINKHAASSPSENRHQLSHAETPNQYG